MVVHSYTTNETSDAKIWIPLENNPTVFSHLIRSLGVSSKLSFHDVYTLDDPALLDLIPRPVLALIVLCPPDVFHRARDKEVEEMLEYTGTGEMPVMWFRQTIREACGMMALLHSLCNGPARHYIQPGSILDNIRKESIPLAPTERAAVLYNSQGLEEAHMAAAQLGDTSAPALGCNAAHHFIAFVKGDDGHLWELNGGMKGPADRGVLGLDDDALSETALRLGVRTLIDKGEGNTSFSVVALSLDQ